MNANVSKLLNEQINKEFYARVKECLEAFDERQDTVQN